MNIRETLSQEKFATSAERVPALESLLVPTVPLAASPTAEDDVSQEGFVDDVKTFAGDVARNYQQGKRPKLKRVRRDRGRLLSILRSYYANPNWVNCRRIVEDEIKHGGFADYLSVGNELATPEDIDTVIRDIGEKAELYINLLSTYEREMRPVSDFVRKSPVTDDVLSEAAQRLRRLTHPDLRFVRPLTIDFRIVMGPRFYQHRTHRSASGGVMDITYPLRWPNKRIPALTAEQIVAYANKVIELLQLIADVEERVLDIVASTTLSFAANPNWQGWDKIEEYRYGKGKLFKHLDKDAFEDDEDVDDPAYRALYSITSTFMTDPKKAGDWESILSSFSGEGYVGPRLLNTAAIDIAMAVSKWIDSSLR